MTQHDPPPATPPRPRLAQLPLPRHWLLLTLAGAAAIVGLGIAAKAVPGALGWQLALDEELTDHHHAVLDAISVGLSTALSPAGDAALLLASFLFLLFSRRAPIDAVAFTGLAAFGWLSSEVFKILVAEPRPDGALLDHPLLAESGRDSFPSGHTTFVAAYAIACWLLSRGTRWQRTTAILGALATAVMAASRLYASAHYLTDVIGSVLVAATAAVFFSGLWNRFGTRVLGRAAHFVRPRRRRSETG